MPTAQSWKRPSRSESGRAFQGTAALTGGVFPRPHAEGSLPHSGHGPHQHPALLCSEETEAMADYTGQPLALGTLLAVCSAGVGAPKQNFNMGLSPVSQACCLWDHNTAGSGSLQTALEGRSCPRDPGGKSRVCSAVLLLGLSVDSFLLGLQAEGAVPERSQEHLSPCDPLGDQGGYCSTASGEGSRGKNAGLLALCLPCTGSFWTCFCFLLSLSLWLILGLPSGVGVLSPSPLQ